MAQPKKGKKKWKCGCGEKFSKKKFKKHVKICEAAVVSSSSSDEEFKYEESPQPRKSGGFFSRLFSFSTTKEPEEYKMRCEGCKECFDSEESNDIHFLENCAHIICHDCLKQITTEKYGKEDTVPCPKCGGPITDYEIKYVLGEDFYNKLQQDAIGNILGEDYSLVHCDCGNMFEFTKSKTDYSVKDENGNTLSKKAAKHYAKRRVRCNACEENFCIKCKVKPYHIGYTCKEYKKFKKGKKCRFCGELIPKSKKKKGAFKKVCDNQECIDQINACCDKIHDCGHPCKGFAGEEDCLSCLHPDCVEENHRPTLDQNDDTFCTICYISGLGEKPCIQLGCKHIFHVDCITEIIQNKWAGPRITFLFKKCPSCKAEIDAYNHPQISELLEEACELEEEIIKLAVERAKVEGIDKDPRLKNKKDEYYNDLERYAMERMSYYTCHQCENPYYGGLKECGNMAQAEGNFNAEELVCGKCSSEGLAGKTDCSIHGKEYIEFKCRYCCTISQWFCFGTTHFCDPCHRIAGRNKITKCPGKDKCGIKVEHPDNGEEFALGCGLCRHAAGSEM
ncbi:unnamed protein product [Moneuplotes crassus]|uniref:RING-type domain-containing protein n=1 Tax=Euplotes crassus TaxID=5936 RepID=A0AAD1U919_EUPCR|nr:unnamed protein product [Moneuplotes crassus]